jgi:flagellar biosynthesis/type III secretory pathway M-ring protein FliF/YscJ
MTVPQRRVTPADVESKLRQLQGDVKQSTRSATPKIAAVGAGALIIAILIAFLLGKRRGKRKSTVIEVRRL